MQWKQDTASIEKEEMKSYVDNQLERASKV